MRRWESLIALEAEAMADRIKAHRSEHAAIVKAARAVARASRAVIERTTARATASRKSPELRSREKPGTP